MKIKKMLTGVLSLALCASVLVGCGGSGSNDNSITVNLGSEPSKLNTVLATGSPDGNVLRHCMEGLVTLDENDEAQPGVATEWETSEDGKTVTFKLRKDATWSNGEKVTAKDFEFAFTQQFNQANAADYASTWAPLVEGAEEFYAATADGTDTDAAKAAFKNRGWVAEDDYTFVVHLVNPTTYFVPLMAYTSFYPVNEAAWNDFGGAEEYATEADKMIYNGAFEITEWTHEDQIVFAKRADYWNADKINLDKMTFRMIVDSNAALNEYNSGGLDMVGLTGDQAAQLREEGKEVLKYNDGSNFYLEFNTTKPGLNNAKIRKALTYALDAQQFIENILKNSSTVANSFTPAAISNGEFTKQVGDLMNRDEIAPTGKKEMPAVKKMFEEGLAEEGLTADQLDLELLADEGDSVTTMCAYVQEQFKTILGVDLEINQQTFQSRIEKMNKHDFSIVFAGWGPDYNDPMTFMDLWLTGGGNNHTLWSNAEYDALIKNAAKEADATARTNMLIQAEKILADEMPVGYVYCRVRDYAVSDRVSGIYRTAFQDLNCKFAKVK